MRHYEAIRMHRVRKPKSWWMGLVLIILCLIMQVPSGSPQAAGFTSPKECQSFTGEAHLTCLYHYIERQRQNNAAVESDLNAQDGMMERPSVRGASIEDEGGGQADRAEVPQIAAAPARVPDTTTSGVGPPWECRAYSGAAYLNCLYAYIEIQRSKSEKVEEELKAQKQMLGQLRDQMDRQASASRDLQRSLAERDTTASSVYMAPPIYPGFGYPGFGYGYGYPSYGYPPSGFSLYLGVPGYYWGRPFYGPGFFGPRFGHRHHR
jgi:hypothetical protein